VASAWLAALVFGVGCGGGIVRPCEYGWVRGFVGGIVFVLEFVLWGLIWWGVG
jgi:hypothetical protein